MDQEQNTTTQTKDAAEATVTSTAHTESAKVVDDVSEHKVFAIIGYILPFLFFIPMLNESSKNNQYARTHADQQLTLLVISLAWLVLSKFLYMMLYGLMYMFGSLFNIAMLVLVVIGIINAAKGETKKLPIVGQISLIGNLFK